MRRRFDRRSRSAAALLAAATALGGCGNLTAGGFGEARVVASGDAPDVAGAAGIAGIAPTILAASTSAPLRSDGDEVDPEGELELRFELFLRRVDGSEVPLSDHPLEAELDLSGEIEADVVQIRVPADAYPELRIRFREIEVEVRTGVVIDGQPVTGPIDVEIEDLEVVRSVSLDIADGATVEVLLDLNAATWLSVVDPTLRTVRAEDFADAFSVRVR